MAFLHDRVMSDEELRRVAPSIFAESEHESRSDRYRFYSTGLVVQALREQGFRPVEARQARTRFADRTNYTKHEVVLAPDPSLFPVEVRNLGDMVPRISLTNSHDGSSAYQMAVRMMVLQCLNGLMVCGPGGFGFNVRHAGSKDLACDVIDVSFKVIEELPAIVGNVRRLEATEIERPAALALAEAAHFFRWNGEPGPVQSDQLLTRRRHEDRADTVWGAYNLIQENLVKGGLQGRGSTGRRLTTRSIKAVDADLKLNKALWIMANKLAESVGGE